MGRSAADGVCAPKEGEVELVRSGGACSKRHRRCRRLGRQAAQGRASERAGGQACVCTCVMRVWVCASLCARACVPLCARTYVYDV